MEKGRDMDFDGTSPFRLRVKYVDILPDDPTNSHDDHIHTECEIYINLTGDVSFMVENKIYPVRSGSVIITKPCEYHHCIFHSNRSHGHLWVLFEASGNEKYFPLFFDRLPGENNLIELSEMQKEKISALCFELIENGNNSTASLSCFFRIISILENAGTEKISLMRKCFRAYTRPWRSITCHPRS